MTRQKHVFIHTDGACKGNPGPGGFGVVLQYGEHRRELSGGFRLTTNNRMELMGPIKALQALKHPCKVTLHTDSKYVENAINLGWARRWQRNRWEQRRGKRAANPDLWDILLSLLDQHQVDVVWVKGHAGHAENERCDLLATNAAAQADLPPDEEFERLQGIASKLPPQHPQTELFSPQHHNPENKAPSPAQPQEDT